MNVGGGGVKNIENDSGNLTVLAITDAKIKHQKALAIKKIYSIIVFVRSKNLTNNLWAAIFLDTPTSYTSRPPVLNRKRRKKNDGTKKHLHSNRCSLS